MLPLTLVTRWIVDDVVIDIDIPIGDRLFAADLAHTPAARGAICITARRIAIATANSQRHFDHVALLSHAIERVVRHQNVIAAIHAHPGAVRVVHHIIHELYIIRFVMQPRRDHKLKAGALTCHETIDGAIENLVSLDAKIRAPAFQHRAVIAGIVETIIQNMAVLDCHEIEWKPERARNVIVFDEEILRLVDLERLLRLAFLAVESIQLGTANQDVITIGNMHDVVAAAIAPVGDDVEIDEIQVAHIVDVEIAV